MSFATLKVTFTAELLPRAFSWLRHHRGYISVECGDQDPATSSAVHDIVFAVLKRWLVPIRERLDCGDATVQEYAQVLSALHQEWLNWNASAFDVFQIDVAWDRSVAGEVVGTVGDLRGGEEPPAG